MTVEIKLVKKNVTFEREGVKQRGVNLYIQVGNEYVPIQVCFFANDKCEGRDPAYAGRMTLLCAVAEELPSKAEGGSQANEKNTGKQKENSASHEAG